MKKILAGALVLSLLSCGSDADENQNTNENANLLGVWKMQTNIVISGKDNTTVLHEYLPDDCKKQSTYEYRNDGKYISNDYNNIGNSCIKKNDTRDYVYKPSEQKIIINNSVEAKVLELTSNKLVIYVSDNYDYNGDGTFDYLKYIFYK